MPFYVLNQNNSGGSFAVEKNMSAHEVIIEADSEAEAIDRAVTYTGVYEDDGTDCECCGSRWSMYLDGPYDEPRLAYGQYTVFEWQATRDARGCLGNETALLLLKDGTRHWFEQSFKHEVE